MSDLQENRGHVTARCPFNGQSWLLLEISCAGKKLTRKKAVAEFLEHFPSHLLHLSSVNEKQRFIS